MRQMFSEDIADYFADVLQGVCDQAELVRVVLNGLGEVSRPLIVVRATIPLPIKEVRVDIWRCTITLEYKLTGRLSKDPGEEHSPFLQSDCKYPGGCC